MTSIIILVSKWRKYTPVTPKWSSYGDHWGKRYSRIKNSFFSFLPTDQRLVIVVIKVHLWSSRRPGQDVLNFLQRLCAFLPTFLWRLWHYDLVHNANVLRPYKLWRRTRTTRTYFERSMYGCYSLAKFVLFHGDCAASVHVVPS